MKKEFKVLLVGLFAVVLLDTIGSVTSRQFNFNYGFLSPISFIIYGMVGYIVAKETSLIKGIAFTALMGLFDSTIGLSISMYLNANTGIEHQISIGFWILTVVVMTCLSAFTGLICGGLARMINKKSPTAQH